MNASTRQKMYGIVEAFSQKAHDTGMAVRPIENLFEHSVKHLKQVVEYGDEALERLKKAEANLPKSELYSLRKTLTEVVEAAEANIERLQGAAVPLRKLIAAASDHGK